MTGTSVSIWEIMTIMILGSLLGVGGGNGIFPTIQSHWVVSGSLDASLSAWLFALGHLTPGPKVSYVAGIGYHLQGFAGAAMAMVGLIVPSVFGSGLVSISMNRLQPIVNRISLPSVFVVSGLLAAIGWGLTVPLSPGFAELAIIAVVTYLIGWRDLDPVWVVLSALGIGFLLVI